MDLGFIVREIRSGRVLSMSMGNERATAVYGTPELGANDPLWMQTVEYEIDRSNNPDDSRPGAVGRLRVLWEDRKSTRLNSSHVAISYAVFCLKKNNII